MEGEGKAQPSEKEKDMSEEQIPVESEPETKPEVKEPKMEQDVSVTESGEPSEPSATKEVFRAPIPRVRFKTEPDSKPDVDSKPMPGAQLPPEQVPAQPTQPLPYKEPEWARQPPPGAFHLDIMRGGVEMGRQKLEGSLLVVGRLPQCDVVLAHPSISRFHAVLQYGLNQSRGKKDPCAEGWHIMDLGSTHGTKRNKELLPPKQYVRFRRGHVAQFGGSSRLFLLDGPEEDEEEEAKETLTELKAKADRRKLAMNKILNPDTNFDDSDEEGEEEKEAVEKKESDGISWGLDYDDFTQEKAEEGKEDDGEELDMEALARREDYYKDDPKKALRKFYARLGQDMEFQYEESGIGPKHAWTARLELPLDAPGGQPVVASATTGGSKRDTATQCALEACRLLDAQGLLHPSSSAAAVDSLRKRRNAALADNDFLEEDEDAFFDRTGELEAKRQRRRARLSGAGDGGSGDKAMSYPQLCARLEELGDQMKALEADIAALDGLEGQGKSKPTEADELDAYMRSLRQDGTGAAADGDRAFRLRKSAKKQELVRLKTEAAKVERMAKVARPTQLPSASKPSSRIFIGSMRGAGRKRTLVAPTTQPPQASQDDGEEEEEDGDDSLAQLIAASREEAGEVPAKKTPTEREKKPTETPPVSQPVAKQASPKLTDPSQTANKEEQSKPKTPSETVSDVDQGKIADDIAASKDDAAAEGGDHGDDGGEVGEGGDPGDAGEGAGGGRKRRRQRVRESRKRKAEADATYDAADPDYAVWMPPDNQSGDGRTALNEKLGY